MTKNIDINIKFASAFGMGMIALVGIILIQNFFAGVLPICCTDSHAWGGWVSDRSRIHVTNSDKVMFLLNEIWIYALVFYTLSVMLRMCMRCYQGAYFTPKTYKLLERGGLLIMLSMVGYVVAKNVNMYLFASTIDGVAFDQEYFNPLNLLVLYSICSGCAFWGLDVMLAKRKMTSKELASRIGISEQNLSLLRSGKVKGMRFNTLESICRELDCQPGDLLEFTYDDVK